MKKNMIDYYEEDAEILDIPNMSAIELSDLIESNINTSGRKSKIKIKEINSLIEEFNSRYGKLYARLK